jgi:formylglycine-generating enzyme required for sulfatase activity
MGATRHGRPGEANVDPGANTDEGPVHEVRLSPFLLGKYEVTQGQWVRAPAPGGRNPSGWAPGNEQVRGLTLVHPVEQVSQEDASLACARLGLALPSEAQWEYAARAGTGSVYWTGEEVRSLQGAANIADAALRRGNRSATCTLEIDDGHGVHAPVGSFRANAFGLHDVAGNVCEWCADAYDASYYARSPRVDPSCAIEDQDGARAVVLRGGSWNFDAASCRSACRFRCGPGGRDHLVGFRAALGLED